MGGFIVLPRKANESVNSVEERCQKSLAVFAEKNLTLDARLVRDNFVAYRYHKLVARHDRVIEYPNGDFIFYAGTLMYDGGTGKDALQRYYEDYSARQVDEKKLAGNFNIVLYTQGALASISDFCRYYPVYLHEPSQAFSNSFIAIAKLNEQPQISAQELYEYLLHGFFIGEDTFLRGVRMLDGYKINLFNPTLSTLPRPLGYDELPAKASFDELVEIVATDYKKHFQMLGKAFTGGIGAALSGGFDTRHMLALLRQAGINPYIYVYGGDNHSDVTVAKAIEAGEHLGLVHIDKGLTPKIDEARFAEITLRDLYFFDGIKGVGIIDNGSDLDTRIDRARHAHLQLNGAGGEIYREIWNVADRSSDLQTFIKMRFDRGSYEFCQDRFVPDEYFARFGEKVHHILGTQNDPITRSEAEMLFPFLRNRFAQCNNAANSQITDSLLPYMETYFVYPSYTLPIQYKYEGRFHSALIRAADPTLAKYQSAYGINFFDPVPPAYQAKRMLERHIPFFLRLLVRKYRAKQDPALPYYLAPSYLREIVDLDAPKLSEFIKFSAIKDPEILSRALSVEVLLNHL